MESVDPPAVVLLPGYLFKMSLVLCDSQAPTQQAPDLPEEILFVMRNKRIVH